MPKPKTSTGEKNLISQRLIELRRQHNMSQRLLAYQLQSFDFTQDSMDILLRYEELFQKHPQCKREWRER